MSTKQGSQRGVVRSLLILTLTFTGVLACRARAPVPEQRYPLKGKVVSVDKRGRAVNVAHESIPGYMEAMTMPFTLKDERLLGELADGDRIQATLVVAGPRSWLEDVVVTRETVDQSSLSNPENRIEPAPGDELPNVTLVNQDGKRISFGMFRGRVVAVTFIYTRCPLPDYCPMMTDNFTEIQKAVKADAALYGKTHLLSISVDPEYDSAKVLRQYATEHEADTYHWDFASGSKDEVKKIATYFGMQYWREGDQIIHSLRTAIVGADGRFVKLYRGNEWKPEEIVTELRTQAAEEVADSQIYHAVGVVESIDRETHTVQIDHEDIKDLMTAMSMPFAVKDNSLLEKVAPRDKVDFWVQSTPAGLVVVRIEKK